MSRFARRPAGLAAVVAAVLAIGLAGAAAAECEGDSCQVPPAAPQDPTPGTATVEGPANPPVSFPSRHGNKQGKKHRKKHHGKHRRKHRKTQGKKKGHRSALGKR